MEPLNLSSLGQRGIDKNMQVGKAQHTGRGGWSGVWSSIISWWVDGFQMMVGLEQALLYRWGIRGSNRELCTSTGHCTWGMNCRFIHPGVNDKGNYSLISKPEPFSPNGAPPIGPHPLMPANPWVCTPFVWIPGFCIQLLSPAPGGAKVLS